MNSTIMKYSHQENTATILHLALYIFIQTLASHFLLVIKNNTIADVMAYFSALSRKTLNCFRTY